MKYSEFKKQIEKLGLGITEGKDCIYISTPECNDGFLAVFKNRMGIVNFNSIYAGSLSTRNLSKILNSAIKLSRTHFDEREDEPKFYVKLTPDTGHQYPNWLRKENVFADVVSGLPNENGCVFDKSSYSELIEQHPEWRPFLLDYDANNTDVFVPVKDGDEE